MSLDPETRTRLHQTDRAFLGQPLSLTVNCVPAVQANTRHMALLLKDATIPDRASRAAAFAEALIDATIGAEIAAPLACAKGCFHCCTTYVSCTLPEVFRLARAVRGKPATRARIGAAAARAKAMEQLRREIDRVHCPILENGACSEYAHRPQICRVVVSTSLDRCLDIFQRGKGGAFAYPQGAEAMRVYALIMLRAALIASGLPHQHYELTHALEIALAHEDAEARWLAGEPLFAAVAVDRAERQPSAVMDLASGLADAVKQTL